MTVNSNDPTNITLEKKIIHSDNETKSHVSAVTAQEALDYHSKGRPGKISIVASKPMTTQRHLSLAYSPGVAEPCKEIQKNPDDVYKYTGKGNNVAVITNGTAVLGLGDLGALSSKPVMEGKSVLFKRFADIDSIDIEIDTKDCEEFINTVKNIAPSFGGINLEDIASPECFIIEEELKETLDIPVFHDDQHGTAVITAAGVINACHITKRELKDIKVVINGAGAAAIACTKLLVKLGADKKNIYMCDRTGVIYQGRNKDMNEWKEIFAQKDASVKTLSEALEGADLFLGLSVAGALTKDMIKVMADNPIIFAMANPVPEIMPEEAKEVRPDAIIATGRSDYNNQVNNVSGFPYLFRGALDVRAKKINDEMKIAAAHALANLARQPILEDVARAYQGKKMRYGPDYIIPVPFDQRLIHTIPIAVAKAAIETGVARINIDDWDAYEQSLKERLNPTQNSLNLLFGNVRNHPRNLVFAGDDIEKIIRISKSWVDDKYGETAIAVQSHNIETVHDKMEELGISKGSITIIDINNDLSLDHCCEFLYNKMQRKGYTLAKCKHEITSNPEIFVLTLAELGYYDVSLLISKHNYQNNVIQAQKILSLDSNINKIFGYSIVIANDKTVFVADTAMIELSSSEELVIIAKHLSKIVQDFGLKPRVAFVSFSNFGDDEQDEALRVRRAKDLLDQEKVDFEYDGEMSVDVALNSELLASYPFTNLSGPANILVMPGLHSANISVNLISSLGGAKVIGPILTGFNSSVQIVPPIVDVHDTVNLAAIASLYSNKK